MKYYLIVGEASGDLHASHLMAALKAEDPQADFRFFGGDLMAAVGGTMVKHYKEYPLPEVPSAVWNPWNGGLRVPCDGSRIRQRRSQ